VRSFGSIFIPVLMAHLIVSQPLEKPFLGTIEVGIIGFGAFSLNVSLNSLFPDFFFQSIASFSIVNWRHYTRK